MLSDELTHEQIVRVWVGTANLEEFHQVMELTMNIPTDRHRTFLTTTSETDQHKEQFRNVPLVAH